VSAKPETSEGSPAPAKSKKLLIIIGVAVLVMVLGGAGAFYFISKQRAAAAAEEGGDDAAPAKAAAHAEKKAPPVYLPLDPMVVNLADPGGEKVAQVGITLEVTDEKASANVKLYLPTIRSSVLLLISQRTAEELLKPEGKQRLAKDILRKAAVPFGGDDSEEHADPVDETPKGKPSKKKKAEHDDFPVVGVLFSSFIVQ
jgi:flagellar FliL protein